MKADDKTTLSPSQYRPPPVNEEQKETEKRFVSDFQDECLAISCKLVELALLYFSAQMPWRIPSMAANVAPSQYRPSPVCEEQKEREKGFILDFQNKCLGASHPRQQTYSRPTTGQ